jgi:hypothetical protein
MEVQWSAKQPAGPLVNLYITELWVLFVECETIETQFSARQPQKV